MRRGRGEREEEEEGGIREEGEKRGRREGNREGGEYLNEESKFEDKIKM